MNIVLLGAPGSGKGTQAKHLRDDFKLVHVASGDLFRDHLGRNTPLGVAAKAYMDRGDLVPDKVTIDMLLERLSQSDVRSGVVLDGFPRTLKQAKALDDMLAKLAQRLERVIYLRVSDDEIVRRLSGRMICRQCQLPFHQTFHPFETCPENRCQGEFLYQRRDDRPETIRARLENYRLQTEPLVDYYTSRHLLVTISGEGTLQSVREAMGRAVRSGMEEDVAGALELP